MFLQILLILICIIIFYHIYWKRRNLPPGPIPLPFLGNTVEISKNQPGYELYKKWSKQYGPVYTFWLGETPLVAVTDYDLIVETFIKDGDAYAGRQQLPSILLHVRGGYNGVLFTEGQLWRDQRRFALHVLRDFGIGKNIMQERVFVEISSLIEHIQKDIKNGIQEQNIIPYIDVAVGSLINGLLFGYRFEGQSLREYYDLKEKLKKFVSSTGNPWIFAIQKNYSYTKYLPFFRHYYNEMKEAADVLLQFYQRQLDEHQQHADHDSEPTNYVEAFLREQARREADGDVGDFTMQQLLVTCFDLWNAGQDTTANTIAWGIIYLMQEPEIQDKMQQELDSIIGTDRLVSLEDKPKLDYTMAVINEIQRMANLIPVIVRHTTTRDVTIKGFHIPKGTEIIPHISVVLCDEKIFPDPYKFDPTRFLDKNGHLKKIDEFIPFSVGKRQCLGEGLARMELFLFITNIFNQFKIDIIPTKPPSMIKQAGGTVAPEPFVCRIKKRY